MERPFIAENAREFERLRSLVDKLTEDDLNLAMEEGWTVAAALAHLAFWDRRSLVLMRKWSSSEIEPSPIDIDVANDSLLPLFYFQFYFRLPALQPSNGHVRQDILLFFLVYILFLRRS